MRNGIKPVIFGALIAMLPVMASAQVQCINPGSWRWYSNLAYDYDLTRGPGRAYQDNTYTKAIQNAAPVYMNTDLNYGVGPGGKGRVKFQNQGWPFIRVLAWARTWSGDTECTIFSGQGVADANVCNGTTMKADRGEITYNDAYLLYANADKLEIVTLHEVGHIFGLGHVTATSCNTFMRTQFSTNLPNKLTTAEKNWINDNY